MWQTPTAFRGRAGPNLPLTEEMIRLDPGLSFCSRVCLLDPGPRRVALVVFDRRVDVRGRRHGPL
jgi:hypothetical protein